VEIYEAVRPLSRILYALSLGRYGDVPQPRDSPNIRSGARDADAVLLLGNGPCHGWGVTTHELALAGHLSRAAAARSGRPTDVDFVGDERMNMTSSVAWLGDRDLSGYHAVSIVIGVNDAVRLTPLREWIPALRALLDSLSARMRPGARIVLWSIQPIRSVRMYDGAVGALADLHTPRLNAAARSVAADYGNVDCRELPTVQPDLARPFGSPAMYAEWAAAIADAVAPAVAAARAVDDAQVELPLAAPDWAGMAEAMRFAPDGGSPELQRLTALARSRFDVELAAVSLLEGDRLWYATPAGLPSSIPADLSFCQQAVLADDTLVVPDARRDARFAGNPLLELGHIQFYAGTPLQSLAGENIGTFCLMGARPKKPTPADVATLEFLAGQAQEELWRLERMATREPDPVG
jgi:GAF domain-containing protein